MRVYAFPADRHGCGFYRVIWPARQLQRDGYNVTIVEPNERDKMMQGAIRDGRMVSVNIPEDADVIVLQRVTHRYLVQAIPLMRQRGVAVVVDMDDDLTCIHPANPAFSMLHPRNGNVDHSWQNTLDACEAATLVTVSTPALAQRYGRAGNAEVLYNAVPARMLDVPHEDSDVVGWGGSIHSHPTDLQVMGPAIAQPLQNGGRFRVAGSVVGVHAALGVPIHVPIEETGVIHDIEAWPLAVNTLGIGVAPLADSKFNAAKSWLKMAEYAACGVPCVGSPRAEYSRIAKLGVGWLAKNPSDWRGKLNTLVRSTATRTELAEQGRAAMRAHTIEGNAWRWWELWSLALKQQRVNPLTRATI